jgi:hypothetical protein
MSEQHQQNEAENNDAQESNDPKDSKDEMPSPPYETIMDDTINERDEQDEMHDVPASKNTRQVNEFPAPMDL